MSLNFFVRVSLAAGLAAGSFLGLGCGDDDGGASSGSDAGGETKDGGGGGGSTAKTSKAISAAAGGTVSLGGAKLTIPGGALADDTTVTVEVLDKADQPGASDIVADVYDFGPDGTQFLKPVTLELDVGDLEVPSGKQAMLAFLDGSAWTALEDSKLQGGKVSATTTHFTPFTVVLVLLPDGGTDQSGGGCGSPDSFDACGGDLTGTWEYTAGCLTLPPDVLGGNPMDNPFAMCTEQPQLSATLDISGTSTFNADGTYMLDQTVSSSAEVVIPASCVDELTGGMEPAMACEQIFMGMLDADGNCKGALGEPTTNMDTGSGTYTTDEANGTLVIMEASDGGTPDGGSGDQEIRYCVNGDTVTVLVTNGDGTVIQYMAMRTTP